MSQEQTPIQKKIKALKKEYSGADTYNDPIFDLEGFALALAQYIKGEVLPNKQATAISDRTIVETREDIGFNRCCSKVVDNFKELGL